MKGVYSPIPFGSRRWERDEGSVLTDPVWESEVGQGWRECTHRSRLGVGGGTGMKGVYSPIPFGSRRWERDEGSVLTDPVWESEVGQGWRECTHRSRLGVGGGTGMKGVYSPIPFGSRRWDRDEGSVLTDPVWELEVGQGWRECTHRSRLGVGGGTGMKGVYSPIPFGSRRWERDEGSVLTDPVWESEVGQGWRECMHRSRLGVGGGKGIKGVYSPIPFGSRRWERDEGSVLTDPVWESEVGLEWRECTHRSRLGVGGGTGMKGVYSPIPFGSRRWDRDEGSVLTDPVWESEVGKGWRECTHRSRLGVGGGTGMKGAYSPIPFGSRRWDRDEGSVLTDPVWELEVGQGWRECTHRSRLGVRGGTGMKGVYSPIPFGSRRWERDEGSVRTDPVWELEVGKGWRECTHRSRLGVRGGKGMKGVYSPIPFGSWRWDRDEGSVLTDPVWESEVGKGWRECTHRSRLGVGGGKGMKGVYSPIPFGSRRWDRDEGSVLTDPVWESEVGKGWRECTHRSRLGVGGGKGMKGVYSPIPFGSRR